MSTLNEDTIFRISHAAQTRLREAAKAAGMPVQRYFRIKALQLVKIAAPTFDVSGDDLHCRLEAGIAPRVLEGLRELYRDLGVPPQAAGELVACAAFMPVLSA
jgi:hypothetical protein